MNGGLREGDPRRAGPFTLLRRLGEGGMGTVFLGRAPDGRQVAVKLIHRQWAADPDFRRRFTREIAAAQRVARFCTAPVLAADVDGDIAYLVTEYVPGPTLREAVRVHGPLSGSHLETVAVSVAVALQAIHGAGVVHRDLKPGNVLLSPLGPKVIDFGIAQLAEPGAHVSSVVVGTPSFMSPEQARGEPVTPASDVFSWGALIAYAAAGRPPFGDGPLPNVLYRVVHDEPDLAALEPGLRAIVARALAKHPALRPTAQQLLDALTRHNPAALPDRTAALGGAVPAEGAGIPGTTGNTGSAEGTGHRQGGTGTIVTRRRPGIVVGAVAAAVLVTTGAIVAVRLGAADGDEGSRMRALSTSSARASTPAPAETAGGIGADGSAASTKPSTDSSTEAGGDSGVGAGNPLGGRNVRFYVSPDSDASRAASTLRASGRSSDAALMAALAEAPKAVWLERWSGPADAARAVRATLDVAARQGAVAVFVTNAIPLRDCHPGGLPDSRAYSSWIDTIAETIGDSPTVIILEPNSLSKLPGGNSCDLGGPEGGKTRYAQLSDAVERLGRLPNTAVYLDGGQQHWPAVENAATRLIEAGIDRADGFYLNASGFQPTAQIEAYGIKLAKCVHVVRSTGRNDCLDAEIDAVPDDAAGLPHFVIDTARNGKGEWTPPDGKYKDPQTWCNPPGRGVGIRATTATASELTDAYLWIRDPTRSSGRCRRGASGPEDPVYGVASPEGGVFWPDLALQRAGDAVPPLR